MRDEFNIFENLNENMSYEEIQSYYINDNDPKLEKWLDKIQIYNIFNLKDLYVYNFQRNYRARRTIYPTLVQGTDYLDIVHLPDSIKEVAQDSLLNITKTFDSKVMRYFMQKTLNITSEDYDRDLQLIGEQVNGIIEHMMNNKADAARLEEFISFTRFLDQKRGESIVQVVPQLRDLFS